VELDENYDGSIDTDIEEGLYKDLNHDNVFVWHEYDQGKFVESGRIGVKTMMDRMIQLCYSATTDATTNPDIDALMTLYRNGMADALTAFNETLHVYAEETS
jgi:hypothetical protein